MTKKILIIAPAWVGDLVMAQVLLKYLKNADKNCVIDIVVPAFLSGLVGRFPEVAECFSLAVGHGEFELKKRWQLAKLLEKKQYDEAFILPNSWKSALIPWFAKIKNRCGWRGEWRFGLLNDVRRLDKKDLPLMIQRFAQLLKPKNAPPLSAESLAPFWPQLAVDSISQQKTLERLQLNTSKKIIVLCPGAEYGPAKRWPTEYFAEVAQEKINAGWQVWIMGGPKDVPLAEQIAVLVKGECKQLCGQTSLTEAVDLMALSSMVVTNDSGLMHIAAALSRPTVALYGSSSPMFTPPLSIAVKILSLNFSCSPCFQRTCPLIHFRCLKELMPSLVLKTIAELQEVV